MDSSFQLAQKNLLRYEGGYSNHPADPGGVTLEGVTQARYNEYRRWKQRPQKPLTRDMIGRVEWVAERDEIYRHYYWLPPRCPELKAGVDAAIYDYAVNSGPSRATKVLQRLVGTKATGTMDSVTVQAANRRDPRALVNAICDERLAFLRSLKTFPVFGAGWTSRVSSVRFYAGRLAAGQQSGAVAAESLGKGEVPDSKVAKGVAKSTPPAVAVAVSPWWQWIVDNPGKTAIIAALIGIAVYLIVKRLNERRREKQEAETPGFKIVPEAIS